MYQIDYDLAIEQPDQIAGHCRLGATLAVTRRDATNTLSCARDLITSLHGSPAANPITLRLMVCSADRLLAEGPTPEQRPALLLMSGDQIMPMMSKRPMLRAIHQLIESASVLFR
jgi:hypothetical protein